MFGLGQVAGDLLPGLVAAGQVQDALQAAVVERRAGDHDGRGLLVRARVPRWVPRDVDEQRPAGSHTVKSWRAKSLTLNLLAKRYKHKQVQQQDQGQRVRTKICPGLFLWKLKFR